MRKILAWVTNLGTAWGFVPTSVATYVAAGLWVAVMAVAGYVQQIPIFWIMMGLPLAGAAIFTFTLRVSEWRERQRVENKLQYCRPRVMQKKKPGTDDLEGFSIGFELVNKATFPVEFELKSLNTRIGDVYPPNKPYAKRNIVMPPGSTGWFDDWIIKVDSTPSREPLEGKIDFTITFGRPGALKHTLARQATVHIGFTPDGKFAGANWHEGL